MFTLRHAATVAVKSGLRAKHCLPDLPYDYAALEPIISRDIMFLHHGKHHQTYVNNLNAAEDKLKSAIEKGDISAQIELAPALRFNGGGHINHSIFWRTLTPSTTEPSKELCVAIQSAFGGMEQMKKALSAPTIAIQGSGWGWLAYDKNAGSLKVITCANQDPLVATTGLYPVFGIDVWEHAYYLQYKNARADYVNAIFDIIDWKGVSEMFKNATAGVAKF